ncbi:dephospho-CoA kinase isoform X1 [Punica granatum]|uniref:Dephospho-CoA kinase isoform X1 n=1 Tax=Punica granatum TaxID=22663 RepID=A0A6P8C0B9_PUNGR|nr:dephospho-CoA kinase isoform X1 [Punica granatum]
MRIVGLTGGIGSGKSTVSNLFKSHGVPVVDADVVARDVLKKGTGGWKEVVTAFGEQILQDDGEVDRPKLGQIVFSDPSKRQLLNRSYDWSTNSLSKLLRQLLLTLHRDLLKFPLGCIYSCRLLAPYISSGIIKEILKLWLKGSKVIVLDIPLLFEVKMDRWTKPIIVVWVDPETQLRRLMARDGSNEEDARNRIEAQMPLDLKRSQADIVIDNTGSMDDLNERFKEVCKEVTRPLTWKEFALSRQGALLAFFSVVVGVVALNKASNGNVS